MPSQTPGSGTEGGTPHDFPKALLTARLNPLRHLLPWRHLPELGNPTLHWAQLETPAV